MHPVIIVRHPKERLSKCSLRGLEGREGLEFRRATRSFRLDVRGHLLLQLGAPVLTAAHRLDPTTGRPRPLVLLDSTWRLVPQLEASLDNLAEAVPVGLPAALQTAYPRTSKLAEDPPGRLSSIEALYVALRLLGEDDPTVLAGYHWREAFLEALRRHPAFASTREL